MKTNGFSLIELLVVIALMSILLTVGLPSFKSLLGNTRLTSATNSMVSALQLARSEAIKRQKTVVIRKKETWLNGWDIFVDDKVPNNTFDSDETLLTTFNAANLALSEEETYANYVSYGSKGRVNVAGHFTFCSGSNYRSIIIAATGRIRTASITSCK